MKRCRKRDLHLEVIAHPVPMETMAEMIIAALWGSADAAAKDFLEWQAKKEVMKS